jgi:hypothetical protein
MKKVAFKTVKTTIAGETTELDYAKNIHALLLIPLDPEKGTNYEEMEKVIPILEKFKLAVGDYLILENAEHEEVIKRLKNAQFRENTPEIFDMVQSVIDAPDYALKEVKDG